VKFFGDKLADKFKCPNCTSVRTKPLAVAISGGTRRRTTVGVSRRSAWRSSSTYKSDFVSSLPERPSNSIAYIAVFIGVCGLLFGILVANSGEGGIAAIIIGISALFVTFGFLVKKPAEQLETAQSTWDSRWVCARCGHQFQQAQ
jgi:hypothetical protein